MKKDLAKMLVVASVFCQGAGTLYAKTLVIDGKNVDYKLDPISLYVNENEIETKVMEPVQLDNRVLVPTREVFEAMGAQVLWDNASKTVTVRYKNKEVVLVVNKTTAMVDNEAVALDVPAKIINNKVMIPIRFVSEAIGLKVDWDAENRFVKIKEPKEEIVNKILDLKMDKEDDILRATIFSSIPMEDIKLTVLDTKVIVDVIKSKCGLDATIEPIINNTYVEKVRTSQFTEDTTRIVFDLKVPTKVVTSLSDDLKKYELQFVEQKDQVIDDTPIIDKPVEDTENKPVDTPPTEDAPSTDVDMPNERFYVAGSKPTFYLEDIKTSQIKVEDDYRNKKLTFDLGADYSEHLPNMMIKLNDAYVASVDIKTEGTTKLTVLTQKVYSYQIEESDTGTTLKLIRPREKYDQIIVLDLGHGGSDNGAVGNGLTEKAINYNQGMALYELLENDPNIKVYMTRETDTYPTLKFRAALANDIGADLFVSIHNNSAASHVTGAETLYYPHSDDTRGKKIAQLVQDSLVECGLVNRGIKERPDLYVLNSTNMPAILIETGFISNPEEAKLINSPEFIKKWSKGVYNALVTGFEKYLQR